MWSLFCRQFNVASCLQRVGYSVTACRGVWKFTCCELTPPHPRVTIQVDRRIVWLKVANYMTIRQNVPDTVTTYRYTIRIVSTFHLYDNILFLRPRARQGCVSARSHMSKLLVQTSQNIFFSCCLWLWSWFGHLLTTVLMYFRFCGGRHVFTW